MKRGFFQTQQSQRSAKANPFSGLDARGFQRNQYSDPIWKAYCIERITDELPEGASVVSMVYAFELVPDPVVRLKIRLADESVDTLEIRVRMDRQMRKWGGDIPKMLSEFVRLTYAA